MPRPRKPTALKILTGAAAHNPQRINPAEPKPKLIPLTSHPPAWLELSPTGRRAWRTIAPILRGMKVATTADPLAIGLLCDVLATYVTARDTLREEGLTFRTVNKNGEEMIRAHPAAAIASDSWRRARLMLNDYGLTAASRAKVSAVEIAEHDPLAEWEAAR